MVCTKDEYTLNSYLAADTDCSDAGTESIAKAKWTVCVATFDKIKSMTALSNVIFSSTQFDTAATATTVATAMKMTIAATAAYAVTQW